MWRSPAIKPDDDVRPGERPANFENLPNIEGTSVREVAGATCPARPPVASQARRRLRIARPIKTPGVISSNSKITRCPFRQIIENGGPSSVSSRADWIDSSSGACSIALRSAAT